MPAKAPVTPEVAAALLRALGERIRAHRKSLRVNATAAAEAAGMSRVTLHRIEGGEPSVTMGAYMNALAALGLGLALTGADEPSTKETMAPALDTSQWIPVRIRLADYPELKRLAWQVHGTDELTPLEALGIYERNWRHLDFAAMPLHERDLANALRRGLSDEAPHV